MNAPQASTRRMQLLAVVAVVLVSVQCSEPASTNGGFTLPDGGGATNGSDAAGGGTDAAVTDGGDAGGSGSDISATQCVAVGDCEPGVDFTCATGQYCDPCTKTCEAERLLCDPCLNDVQCQKAKFGTACLPYTSGGTFCGLACIGDAGCPKSYSCKTVAGETSKQCMPKSASCQPLAGACKSDADCPFTTICNVDYGKCIKGCEEDESCPGDQVCSLWRCKPPCASDDVCKAQAADAVCEAEHCKIPGGCLGPAECPDQETYCDMAAHKCVPGCQADFDCKEYGKKCVAGTCQQVGCEFNWECSFGLVCDPPSGKCVTPAEPYCGVCNADDENATECGGPPAKCLKLADADGNEKGSFCAIACSDAPAGACPQGYDCTELTDQDGNSQGKICIRQCWVDPVDPSDG